MPKIAVAAAAAASMLATAAFAQTGDVHGVRRALIDALARRDRDAVARMVKYPAVAVVAGLNIPLSDRETVLSVYEVVFTPDLRCRLERFGVTMDAGNATLGGAVRLEQDGGTFRIARIDVPPATGTVGGASKTEQAIFRRGQAQFSGRLGGSAVDTYLVNARKGARLEARIEKFPGRSAFVRVLDPANRPLERRGAEAPRVWAGTLAADGQHRVQVVRLAPYCDPPFTYFLTITLR